MITIYKMPAPGYAHAEVEVYGDPEMGWYEWRMTGENPYDTGAEKSADIAWYQGRQYSQAESALRDALMVASGLPDPFMTES